MPKIAAPTSSLRTPRIMRPSNFVRSTTTSSGTRKIRVTDSEFGRFMRRVKAMITSLVAYEGHHARGGQGHAPPTAHHSYAQADRPDLRATVSPLPTRSAEEGSGDRRGGAEPELPAAPYRRNLR